MKDFKMIDYDHLQGGSPCNGNLSDVGGAFKAHWTFEGRGGTATEARALTDAEFALLWDGIAASISGGGVFGRCLVADPTRLIDPELVNRHPRLALPQPRCRWRLSKAGNVLNLPGICSSERCLSYGLRAWRQKAKIVKLYQWPTQ